ncbi:hypothetical protein FACS189421_02200 [Bacteroidia bacterium]|nr:hypothetical protein FACS189421_02200 [Bacteroidia bacterium]
MKTIYFYLIGLAFLLFSCEEKTLEPVSASKGKPAVVTQITTEATAGGVIISYRIPNDEDILGVKAIYTLTNGKTYESVSSYYVNNLVIEGYNDTIPHQAQVYTINRAQELSDAVTVTFTPLEAPVSKIAKTVDIINTFGGIVFTWENPDKAPLTFELFAALKGKALEPKGGTTSRLPVDMSVIRGLPGEPHQFGLLVRDLWGNQSDTIYPPDGELLIPFVEEELNKRIMVAYKLDSDANFDAYEGEYEYMLDDNLGTWSHTLPMNANGASFTIDLGKPVTLSSFKLFHRPRSSDNQHAGYYNQGNVRKFELFGSLEQPSQSGDWSEWTKLMDCEVLKPSGQPFPAMTDDELTQAEEGFPFSLPMSEEYVRYLRFRINTVWGGLNEYIYIAELTFYGQYAQ